MTHKVIVHTRAFETDIVEIRWTLKDNTIFYQRITIPPKSTREVRIGQQVSNDGRAEEKTSK